MRKLLVMILALLPMVAFGAKKRIKTNDCRPSVNVCIERFAERMEKKHGFDKNEIREFLKSIEKDEDALKLFRGHPRGVFTPEELDYFRELSEKRIDHGLEFWQSNAAALERAESEYGVSAKAIVGLIGIETAYGEYMGRFKAHEALFTLGFYAHRRQSYFQHQLEEFLVLARKMHWDRTHIYSSYAGAIGLPQFMPNNVELFAVDFNNDGVVDLMDPTDAIGSVASFLSAHGWVRGAEIATQQKRFSGRRTAFSSRALPGPKVTYWKKNENFKVLRRYNPLDSYAIAIFIASSKIADERTKVVDLNGTVVIESIDEVQIPKELPSVFGSID